MPPDAIKILVIDNNEDDRLFYRRALRPECGDYILVEKDNGEEGFACIGEVNPSCILLDYSLPGRNGIEVLKRIRSKFPFVPVVMATGQGNEAVAVTAMREGAQNYVSKSSITAETLQRGIRAAIENCGLQQRVQEQRASLETFTRALAHDLKEPVRTIRSFLDLIAHENPPPEKTRRYFDYITQAAERMSAMIDTVYSYLRLDRAAPQVAQEPCDAAQAFTDAKENLAALIRERKAAVTAGALPAVPANRMQLVQLLQNLIGNAIRHCEAEPAVHVSASRGEDGRWLFRVDDNGPGIAQADRERIFEPFKRLAGHAEDGLGLGLAICRKIVEAAGGKIWCAANEPRGASFRFTLADAKLAASPAPVASPLAAVSGGPLASVLIVEDNDADIELIRYTLMDEQKLRCNLLRAHNGLEALALLGEGNTPANPVDLILLDITMPGMDGFEFLAHLRDAEALRAVPVVMCTTSTYDRDIAQAKALGAAGYLIKPLDFACLRPILDSATTLRLREEEDGRVLLRAA